MWAVVVYGNPPDESLMTLSSKGSFDYIAVRYRGWQLRSG
jgi:hypothetical protein